MNPSVAERGVVLLAAGRGSRMGSLTDAVPKAMLEVGGTPLIERILAQALEGTRGEIVVVTGHRGAVVETLVRERFPRRVRTVANPRFDEDVNILSTMIGVEALAAPELGYTIIETDLLVERRGWREIFAGAARGGSFWVTRGAYGPSLTGGIVRADAEGNIDAVAYQPDYDASYDGWAKMLGILSVGAESVAVDRASRAAAVAESVRQYYLAPWAQHVASMPCRTLDLGALFACSFNTAADFEAGAREFLAVEGRPNGECVG